MTFNELIGDSDLLTALVGAGQFLLSVVIAAVTAAWAFRRWIQQRKDEAKARSQQQQEAIRQESQRIEQAKEDAQQRKVEHAAKLIQQFGTYDDDKNRMWGAMALSLYPEQSLPLLTMAIGELDEASCSGVETALMALGTRSIPELSRINRFASSLVSIHEGGAGKGASTVCEDTNELSGTGDSPTITDSPSFEKAERQLIRTRRIINQIILNSNESELQDLDLEDVDMSKCNFRKARLGAIHFRKIILNNAVLSRAILPEANFRGALLQNAVFTHAIATKADFTGATGPVNCIKLDAERAVFSYADFRSSHFDGANLTWCRFEKTKLDDATLNGAQLHHAILKGTRLANVSARAVKMNDAFISHGFLIKADLVEAIVKSTRFENCRLQGANLTSANVSNSDFTNCDLGGVRFRLATFHKNKFRRCNLGGVSFEGAQLTEVSFDNCTFSEMSFENAILDNVVFRGKATEVQKLIELGSAKKLTNVTISEDNAALTRLAQLAAHPRVEHRNTPSSDTLENISSV